MAFFSYFCVSKTPLGASFSSIFLLPLLAAAASAIGRKMQKAGPAELNYPATFAIWNAHTSIKKQVN